MKLPPIVKSPAAQFCFGFTVVNLVTLVLGLNEIYNHEKFGSFRVIGALIALAILVVYWVRIIDHHKSKAGKK